jgi:hypothetical protein
MATNEGTDQKSAIRNLGQDYENMRKDMELKAEADAYERSKSRDEKLGEGMLRFGLNVMGNRKKAEPEPLPGKGKTEKMGESAKPLPGKGKAQKLGEGMQNYKRGGSVSSASARADGCAIRGKTKGKMV